jgi:hypothetical protein
MSRKNGEEGENDRCVSRSILRGSKWIKRIHLTGSRVGQVGSLSPDRGKRTSRERYNQCMQGIRTTEPTQTQMLQTRLI